MTPTDPALEARARQSLGRSAEAIHALALEVLSEIGAGGVIVDVGCGTGGLRPRLSARVDRYVGVDAIRHEGLPPDVEFLLVDLDRAPIPLPSGVADVVVALETIEHLENPRAFMRELTRLARPGGRVLVSTPNQLSLLSLVTLAVRQRFAAFQDSEYPAHRTALLEIDLRRIAAECGLVDVGLRYTTRGRIPLMRWHYPHWIARRLARACSDNLLLCARRPHV